MESLSAACAMPADAVRSYAQLNYRQHYAPLLRQHRAPPEAIAELCLFRFWLACRAWQHAGRPTGASPLHLPPDWPQPRHAAGFDVEYTLGTWFPHLLESRFDLYDRFFQLGRNASDPLGLDAAALALSCQLFVDPSLQMRQWLQTDVQALFDHLLRACAATARHPLAPAHT